MRAGGALRNLSIRKTSIRLLPQRIINQIAAGEVIERPASVIKELIENAIDAGATEITVEIVDGGKNFISVADDGNGMDRDALKMCTLSHATSKLTSENLFDIHTFGFRGEALSSIASVSRLSIVTSDNDAGEGWKLEMEGQEGVEDVSPASRARGTTLEVRDLFFATPARLKFLKSDSYESERCRIVFDDIALANPFISFKLVDLSREKAFYKAAENIAERIKDIFGSSFLKNVFHIDSNKDRSEFVKDPNEGMSLRGYIGVPTFNRSTSSQQYFFVNGRLVKDKTISSTLRSAYLGLIPNGRYPVAILFLEVPYNEVDVNVHPAKTEVRFRNTEQVRSFIASELKKAIEFLGSRRSTTEIMDKFYANAMGVPTRSWQSENRSIPSTIESRTRFDDSTTAAVNLEMPEEVTARGESASRFKDSAGIFAFPSQSASSGSFHSSKNSFISELSQIERENGIIYDKQLHCAPKDKSQNSLQNEVRENPEGNNVESEMKLPEICLGDAVFQVSNTYIIAGSDEGIVIVDQHAAAERIMLEELKKNLKIASQVLLMPIKMKLNLANIELLRKHNGLLEQLGVYVEYSSADNEKDITVSAVPALLETSDVEPLMSDIVDDLTAFGDTYTLDDKIHKILSTMACHSSLRAGKKLSIQEMNYLLRKMEFTKNVAQCCHGRPSYIRLSFKDLNSFFERT